MPAERPDLESVARALEGAEKEDLVRLLLEHLRGGTSETVRQALPPAEEAGIAIPVPDAPVPAADPLSQTDDILASIDRYDAVTRCITDPAFLLRPEALRTLERLAASATPPWIAHPPQYLRRHADDYHPMLPTRAMWYNRPANLRVPEEPLEFGPVAITYPALLPGLTPAHLPLFRALLASPALADARHDAFRDQLSDAVGCLESIRKADDLEELAALSSEPAYPRRDWAFARADAPKERTTARMTFSGHDGPGYVQLGTGDNGAFIEDCQRAEAYPHGVARFYIVSEGKVIGTGLLPMARGTRNTDERYGEALLGEEPPLPETFSFHVVAATESTTGYFSVRELTDLLRTHPDAWDSPSVQEEIERYARMVAAARERDAAGLPAKRTANAAWKPPAEPVTTPAPVRADRRAATVAEPVAPAAEPERQAPDPDPADAAEITAALEAAGVGVTAHRRRILAVIRSLEAPATPKDVMEALRRRYGNCMVPLTFQNNIGVFVAKGLVTQDGGRISAVRGRTQQTEGEADA